MNPEPYSDYVQIGESRIMVFASEIDGKPYWSLGTTSGNVEVAIKSTFDDTTVDQLKRLRKAIDGAIKHIDVKTQKEHVQKGK